MELYSSRRNNIRDPFTGIFRKLYNQKRKFIDKEMCGKASFILFSRMFIVMLSIDRGVLNSHFVMIIVSLDVGFNLFFCIFCAEM